MKRNVGFESTFHFSSVRRYRPRPILHILNPFYFPYHVSSSQPVSICSGDTVDRPTPHSPNPPTAQSPLLHLNALHTMPLHPSRYVSKR